MSTNNFKGVVIVIPTRNRADLAMNAIRSVLGQPECDVRVLVSDNSTSTQEVDELARFCEQLGDHRLRYIRPPQALPMARHWDWAMDQALQSDDASHIIYLTDRMIFKPGELPALLAMTAVYPDKVISYNHDTVVDYRNPIRVLQERWTGKQLEVSAARLLYLSAQVDISGCLPRMLNCVAPRVIIEKIKARFGDVFVSIAPDYCFCYRCLECVDSILYYDKAILVHYALNRSNGMTCGRGLVSDAYADFRADLGATQVNYASPVPEFRTINNAIVHEYCLVKQQTGSPKFPEVNMDRYLMTMTQEITLFEDPAFKREMEALLTAHGYRLKAAILRLRGLLALRHRLKKALSSMKLLGADAAPEKSLEFATVEKALEYAVNSSRERSVTGKHLNSLLEPTAERINFLPEPVTAGTTNWPATADRQT